MPQVEIKYTFDIDLPVTKLFSVIEKTINEHDASSGICKSRAYPCSTFMHTHVFIDIQLLAKAHRDQNFMQTLLSALQSNIKSYLPTQIQFAIHLQFASAYYFTTST